MTRLGRRVPARFPASRAHPEHAQRERGDGEARQQRVVLQHHLQIDRQGDHRPTKGDLLEELLGDPEPEQLGREQLRVEQRRPPLPLAPDEPPDQRRHGDHAERQERGHGLSPLLPHQDAEHDAAHAQDGQDGADHVNGRW
jgi:hypothetical protein